jgi:two-component system LytT family response regulator
MTVSKLSSKRQNLWLVGEFYNAAETNYFLSYNTLDLLFLAIEMPYLRGFKFLDTLKAQPQVIFISSKREYAVKAFD